MFNKCREYTSHVNGPSIGQVSMSSFEDSGILPPHNVGANGPDAKATSFS